MLNMFYKVLLSEFLGICSSVVEVSVLLQRGSKSLGHWFAVLQGNMVSFVRVDMSKKTFWLLKVRPPYQLKML